jgi:hypothetical protein
VFEHATRVIASTEVAASAARAVEGLLQVTSKELVTAA